MEKIIFATGNNDKAREVKEIFNGTGFEIFSLSDIGDRSEIIEDKDTFEENAFVKAEYIFNKYNVPVMADDTGLMVDQLGGRPGIYSARYAGEGCSYADNNKKLRDELCFFDEPHKAKFVCCAVYFDGNNKISVTGEFPGEIINEPRGDQGFGYDPIFVPENSDRTLAEMTMAEKNKISHRAIAFNKLRDQLLKK